MSLRVALAAALCLAFATTAALAGGPGMPSGPYAGITVGAGITNFVDEDYDWYGGQASGLLAGGQVGYNTQLGAASVGIEADATWNNKSGPSQWNSTYTHDWEASLRARIGFDATDFTPYLTAGVAMGGVHMVYSGTTYAYTPIGWTLGIGGETMIRNGVTARIEYRHTDFGTQNYDGYNLHPQDDSVRIGFNVHFGR